jgi:hypothetical protein
MLTMLVIALTFLGIYVSMWPILSEWLLVSPPADPARDFDRDPDVQVPPPLALISSTPTRVAPPRERHPGS